MDRGTAWPYVQPCIHTTCVTLLNDVGCPFPGVCWESVRPGTQLKGGTCIDVQTAPPVRVGTVFIGRTFSRASRRRNQIKAYLFNNYASSWLEEVREDSLVILEVRGTL